MDDEKGARGARSLAGAQRLLVLQHEPACPAGLFGEWACERGHLLEVIEVAALRSWPQPPESGVIVSLGSDCSAHASTDPWIEREACFLARAHAQGVPILGICFGAQLLARALGGTVRRSRRPEVSWKRIETAAPELMSPGPWLRWHEDVFELPPGARELAPADDASLGFQSALSIGLQIHPEADIELAEDWMRLGGRKLAAWGIDADLIREQVRIAGIGARERAFELFDKILAHWRASAATA